MIDRRLAVVVAALLVSVSGHARAQTPTVPVLSYDEYLNTLSAEQRAQLVIRSAEGGVFVPNFDYCVHLQRIDLLRWYITTAGEPVASLCLQTLSQQLPHIQERDEQLFAAALLYRYGFEQGRAHLLAALGDDDPTAAFILGVNHEEGSLDGVVRVFRSQPPSRKRELIRALGTWNQQAASDALVQTYKSDRRNILYGAALSLSGRVDAVPIITEYLETSPPEKTGRMLAAGALARLGVDASQWIAFLREQLTRSDPPMESWPRFAAEALGLAGGSDAESALISRIDSFLADPTPTPGTGAVGRKTERGNAVAAAKALRGFSSPEAAAAVASLLGRIATEADASGPSMAQQQLGSVLLMIGVESGVDAAREQLGDTWVDRVVAVRGLKLIAGQFLPRSSRVVLPELQD